MFSQGVVRCLMALVALACLLVFRDDVVHGRQGCVTGFDPPAVEIPASGTPTSFNVLTATSTCSWGWNGVPGPEWIGTPSNASGTGPGIVTFNLVQPNHQGSPRSAVLTFGGRQITITQVANPCPLSVSPSSVTIPANGGTGSLTVTAGASPCSYTVNPSAGVSILSGASGDQFPATVTFSIGLNATRFARSFFIRVSSLGTFGPTAPALAIHQLGPPVVVDTGSFFGFTFAVYRHASGPPHVTAAEPAQITLPDYPSASWTAETTVPWLVLSPDAGTGATTMMVSVNPTATASLAPGVYPTRVEFVSPVAPQTPEFLQIHLIVADTNSDTVPAGGNIDAPIQGATGLNGAVHVGGWASDDIGIARVQVFRDAVAGEPPGEIYLGDATRVRGARPDISDFVNAPEVRRAGWGLMVLSNVLPNGGNGSFTMKAFADDIEGHRTFLGQRTASYDNTNSILPFGTIDVPGQGATVSGTIAIQGWVLAQPHPGRFIPFDGSTIRLVIDGAEQSAAAAYGFPRPDVAALFTPPLYANADGPAAQFVIDTTLLADGMHAIEWVVTDSEGSTVGIGSRFIHVQNNGGSPARDRPGR